MKNASDRCEGTSVSNEMPAVIKAIFCRALFGLYIGPLHASNENSTISEPRYYAPLDPTLVCNISLRSLLMACQALLEHHLGKEHGPGYSLQEASIAGTTDMAY